jgi:hypothetical protein
MNWTQDRPIEEGWYFWRMKPDDEEPYWDAGYFYYEEDGTPVCLCGESNIYGRSFGHWCRIETEG